MSDEIEAGRELDAQVAEKVMGWRHVRETGPPDDLYGQEPGRSGTVYIVPHYSTDIGAAWAVVERLRDIDCDLTIESAGNQWHVSLLVGAIVGTAQAAPLAICRAALKVVERAATSLLPLCREGT